MLLGEFAAPKIRRKKLIGVGSSAVGGAVSGGGTGALVGLIAKPDSGGAQRKVALAGAAIGAGINAVKKIKSNFKPTKPKLPKVPKPKKPKTV
jgi:hypothetical protein